MTWQIGLELRSQEQNVLQINTKQTVLVMLNIFSLKEKCNILSKFCTVSAAIVHLDHWKGSGTLNGTGP